MIDWTKASIDTPLFSLQGTKTSARVVSVYDADTITVVIPFACSFSKFNLRLFGIDTPEMKSKIAEVKEKAIKARERVINLITGGKAANLSKKELQYYLNANIILVYIECFEQDKWGRTLAKVYLKENESKSISDILLDEKLAYPYFGDTKLTEEQQNVVLDSTL
jgi:endonuclease YncB( thermonuclease family)